MKKILNNFDLDYIGILLIIGCAIYSYVLYANGNDEYIDMIIITAFYSSLVILCFDYNRKLKVLRRVFLRKK